MTCFNTSLTHFFSIAFCVYIFFSYLSNINTRNQYVYIVFNSYFLSYFALMMLKYKKQKQTNNEIIGRSNDDKKTN